MSIGTTKDFERRRVPRVRNHVRTNLDGRHQPLPRHHRRVDVVDVQADPAHPPVGSVAARATRDLSASAILLLAQRGAIDLDDALSGAPARPADMGRETEPAPVDAPRVGHPRLRRPVPRQGVRPHRIVVADSRWEQTGDGAVQTTPTELVTWAAEYWNPTNGGPDMNSQRSDGAVEFEANLAYGAAIMTTGIKAQQPWSRCRFRPRPTCSRSGPVIAESGRATSSRRRHRG